MAGAVVVVIDRLGAGWLGPYGNTWIDTPHFNRLAARSVVWETVIAQSPDLAASYRAFWSGRHAMQPAVSDETPLTALAATAGARSVLVTDEAGLLEHPLASALGEQRLVKPLAPNRCAAEVEETGLFQLLGEAAATVRDVSWPALVWVHSRGMAGPWDAPYEMRQQFADEEDPQPPKFVLPPERRLRRGYDPDELLGIVQAYAGQVALLDLALGMLLEAVEEQPWAGEAIVAVTSPRGYPLGEHLRVGPCDEALYGELIQVPLILRLPQMDTCWRTQRIAQPYELYAAIAEACGWLPPQRGGLLAELRGEEAGGRGVACAIGNQQRAIRTPAWFMRQSLGDGQRNDELFAKPDDRWEANEISSRCGQIVELLAAELEAFELAATRGQLAELPPLAEALRDIWR